MEAITPPQPLSGLRVVELAALPTMYCGKLLADMGADVVLVEPPQGADARALGPFLPDDAGDPRNRSLVFWHYNTSKRGVTLDWQRPEGTSLLRRLLARADVLLEATPPGTLARHGLDWPSLHALNPRLIAVSITPFGQTGPRAGWKATDLIATALGGMLYTSGDTYTPPLAPWGPQAYHLAAMFGALGVLLALSQRASTGEGQHVDVSIQESVAAALEPVFPWYFFEPHLVHRRQGTLHWSRGFRVFPCRDGYILLTLQQNWDTLVQWLESEGMAQDLTDPRYREPAFRRERLDHIIAVLEAWTRTKTVAELMEQGQLLRFTWGKVASPEEVFANEQLRVRGFFVDVDHPELGRSFTYPGAPYAMEGWRIARRAPLLGEHNRELYAELGLEETELTALRAQGVI